MIKSLQKKSYTEFLAIIDLLLQLYKYVMFTWPATSRATQQPAPTLPADNYLSNFELRRDDWTVRAYFVTANWSSVLISSSTTRCTKPKLTEGQPLPIAISCSASAAGTKILLLLL